MLETFKCRSPEAYPSFRMSDIQFDLFIQKEMSLKKNFRHRQLCSMGRSKIHRNGINDSSNCHLIIWQKIIFRHKKNLFLSLRKIKLVPVFLLSWRLFTGEGNFIFASKENWDTFQSQMLLNETFPPFITADVFIRNLSRPVKYSKSRKKYQVENLIKCDVKYFSHDV